VGFWEGGRLTAGENDSEHTRGKKKRFAKKMGHVKRKSRLVGLHFKTTSLEVQGARIDSLIGGLSQGKFLKST